MPALKGAFVKLTGGQLGSQPNVIVFQFNPESVYRSPTLVFPPSRPDGSGPRDATNQAAEPSESISFGLRVDATDQLEEGNALARERGILPALAALELLLQAQPPASDLGGGGAHKNPPARLDTVLFFWGEQRLLPVAVTSLSIYETEYDAQLHPIRAEVSVNLDVLTPSQLDRRDSVSRGAYAYSRRAKTALAARSRGTPTESLTRTFSRL
jgi:hypothetical protein